MAEFVIAKDQDGSGCLVFDAETPRTIEAPHANEAAFLLAEQGERGFIGLIGPAYTPYGETPTHVFSPWHISAEGVVTSLYGDVWQQVDRSEALEVG